MPWSPKDGIGWPMRASSAMSWKPGEMTKTRLASRVALSAADASLDAPGALLA
jgi:hypothetical protein